jgi:hypothetical protein
MGGGRQGAREDVGGGCRFVVFCGHRFCVCVCVLLVVGDRSFPMAVNQGVAQNVPSSARLRRKNAARQRETGTECSCGKLRRYYHYTVTNYSIAHVSSAGAVSGCE